MRPDNHGTPHQKLKQGLRIALILFAGFAVSASAQAPRSSPTILAYAKKVGQGRKATLQELYGMFFAFANHVETRSIADEKHGIDRTFYRQHLQVASGLTPGEYAHVLASAQRFVAIDADVKQRIEDLEKTVRGDEAAQSFRQPSPSDEYKARMNSLYAERQSALDAEIADLRQVLGLERVNVLDTYLQRDFTSGNIGHAPPQESGSTPQSQLDAPDDITYGWPTSQCWDFADSYGNTFSLCIAETVSYLGPGDKVETWAYFTHSAYGGTFDGWTTSGPMFENGNNIIGQYYNCNTTTGYCDINFSYGNDVLYALYGYIDFYFTDADCAPCDAYVHKEVAQVYIAYPDISGLTQTSFIQGQNGSFTIDGQNLESPFENLPTVSLSSSAIFSKFTITSYPGPNYANGGITISYTVASNATPGTYTITVNNAFGSDSYDLEIVGQPPTITSIAVEGATALQAGQTQTVTLTGTNFGTSDQITVLSDSGYITVDSVGSPTPARGPQPSGVKTSSGKSTPTTDTLTFTVTTAADAPSGEANFELMTNDGAQDPNIATPDVTVAPIVLPLPQIMMVTSTAAQQTCTGGTEVDGQTAQVFAGQQMLLCSPAPALPTGVTVTSSTWTPGNIADLSGGFCAPLGVPPAVVLPCPGNPAAGGELPDPKMSGAGVTTLAFFWVVPENLETMTYTYCIDNSATQCATSAVATFDVSGPTGNLLPNAFLQTDNTATVISPSPTSNPATMQMSNSPAHPSAGVYINDLATLPQGSFIWVQIIKSTTYSQLFTPTVGYTPPVNLGIGLDGIYPYPPANNLAASDSPGRSDLYSWLGEAAEVFDATMYVMWDPAIPPAGQSTCTPASVNTSQLIYTSSPSTCASIPVPLGSVEWKWSACAINSFAPTTGGGGFTPLWFAQCGPGLAEPAAASGYPEWSTCDASLHANCQN